TSLPLPDHADIDAELAYVIACWPVIDPLYRYVHVGQGKGRQELIDAHLASFSSEAGMSAASPQTIVEEDEQFAKPPILMMLKANDQNHPQEMQDRFVVSY